MSRRFAIVMMAFSVIFFLSRKSTDLLTQKVLTLGIVVCLWPMAISSLYGVLSNTINTFGLSAVFTEAILALWGTVLLLKKIVIPHTRS